MFKSSQLGGSGATQTAADVLHYGRGGGSPRNLDNYIAEAQNFVARSTPYVVWGWPTANAALCVMGQT